MEISQSNGSRIKMMCNESVGPADLVNAIGFEVMFAAYFSGMIMIVGVILYAVFHRLRKDNCSRKETYLIMFPSILVTITFLPLISPPLDHLVGVLQNLLINFAMFVYVENTLETIKGKHSLLQQSNREVKCPIGTPPLCCLMPCPYPILSKRLLNLVLLPVKVLVIISMLNLVIYASLSYNRLPPPKEFTDLTNIPSVVSIPFQVSTMYTYKIFLSLSQPKLKGSYPRLRGRLIFFTFVIEKTTTLIFVILQAKDVLLPIHGLECVNLSELLLPVVQLGIYFPIAIVIPPLYNKMLVNASINRTVDQEREEKAEGDEEDESKTPLQPDVQT